MITLLEDRLAESRRALKEHEESGFTTAELIGNAALGVAALALLWGMMERQVFPKLIAFITKQLGI